MYIINVISMLYKYRYKTKKDYFACSLTRIKKAFCECLKSIKCVECLDCDKGQTGGNIYKVIYYGDGESENTYRVW